MAVIRNMKNMISCTFFLSSVAAAHVLKATKTICFQIQLNNYKQKKFTHDSVLFVSYCIMHFVGTRKIFEKNESSYEEILIHKSLLYTLSFNTEFE